LKGQFYPKTKKRFNVWFGWKDALAQRINGSGENINIKVKSLENGAALMELTQGTTMVTLLQVTRSVVFTDAISIRGDVSENMKAAIGQLVLLGGRLP